MHLHRLNSLVAVGFSLAFFAAADHAGGASRGIGPLPASTVPYQPATSPTNTTSNSSLSNPASSSNDTYLQGVNIGGWLILERWLYLKGYLFPNDTDSTIRDEWTLSASHQNKSSFEDHWNTFFTSGDVDEIKEAGFNAIRVPIGFWAYNNTGTPYYTGQDAYLERAIGWCQEAGLKVWIDLHGLPGSQNGQQHSGKQGITNWLTPDNEAEAISVLTTIATKYGGANYSDTVTGFGLVNEPNGQYVPNGADNAFDAIEAFALKATTAIKPLITNPNVKIVLGDGFLPPMNFTNLPTFLDTVASRQFAIDDHMYQIYTPADNYESQQTHIDNACRAIPALSAVKAKAPLFIGEWSAHTNVCVDTTNGTKSLGNGRWPTTGTLNCGFPLNQWSTDPTTKWTERVINETRAYVEAQLDVFRQSTSGNFAWTWNGPNDWGVKNGLAVGIFPNPVTSRIFPPACGNTTTASF